MAAASGAPPWLGLGLVAAAVIGLAGYILSAAGGEDPSAGDVPRGAITDASPRHSFMHIACKHHSHGRPWHADHARSILAGRGQQDAEPPR